MRSLHICGLGPGWSLCPPMKPGRMIWGINAILLRRDVNYVFEIHDLYEKLSRVDADGHIRAIRRAEYKGIPYIVQREWDFLPGLKQVVYPLEAVCQRFQTDNIGCSLDAAIALGIYCGWKDIQVYGSGANLASLYDYQVPSNNYWVGVCHGANINIHFHSIGGLRHSDVMRTHDGLVYGFNVPQKKWPTIDTTLPACNCTRRNNYGCTDY